MTVVRFPGSDVSRSQGVLGMPEHTLESNYLFHFVSPEQEKEMEKQKLLYQQARLHDRGAAEMVLQTISASKGSPRSSSWTSSNQTVVKEGLTVCLFSPAGEMGLMVASTLKLGIAILNGGNSTVQQVSLLCN